MFPFTILVPCWIFVITLLSDFFSFLQNEDIIHVVMQRVQVAYHGISNAPVYTKK